MSIFHFVTISKTSKNKSYKTLFRPFKSRGGNYKCLFLRIICNLRNGIEIDLFCLDEVEKLCNFAAEIQ